jgi:hypothetical protein
MVGGWQREDRHRRQKSPVPILKCLPERREAIWALKALGCHSRALGDKKPCAHPQVAPRAARSHIGTQGTGGATQGHWVAKGGWEQKAKKPCSHPQAAPRAARSHIGTEGTGGGPLFLLFLCALYIISRP